MLISIDLDSEIPVGTQLRNEIVFGIATGRLLPGDVLPPVRRMAADLGINMHTVNKAYQKLAEEGMVTLRERSGAVVRDPSAEKNAFLDGRAYDLRVLAADALCHGLSLQDLCRELTDAARGLHREGGA